MIPYVGPQRSARLRNHYRFLETVEGLCRQGQVMSDVTLSIVPVVGFTLE
jgi:hypothetical protein